MFDINELLKRCEEIGNLNILDSFIKSKPKIKLKRRIVCAISGGSDSDVMLDILTKLDKDKKIKYVFFDTGIETQATKKHLDFLEQKYNIKIERRKAIIPVPLGCKKYGQPFWSKHASEMISRLQKHNFKWEDRPFDELIKEYPNCRSALKWWCNEHEDKVGKKGKIAKSKLNINYTFGLKEYMIENPPKFRISQKCCKGAKKDNAKVFLTENKAELHITGIRKSEGGVRSVAYSSCFSLAKGTESWDNYRPIFWYTDKDKTEYEQAFSVIHSECYSKYGLKRTGCAGCPFGKDFEIELRALKENEPKLYKAVNKIFGDSYAYTRGYLEFRTRLKKRDVEFEQMTFEM